MRQGLLPICIVCAVTATSSRKNFDKPSIATEKSFCNSKGVHSRSKQCLRIYKDHFCVAKCLLGNPKPLNYIRWMQATRFLQNALSAHRRNAQPSRNCDDYRDWDCIPTSEWTQQNFNSACEFSLCAHKGSACHGYGSANAIEKLFIRIANRVALLYNWFNEHTHKIGGAVRLKNSKNALL